MYLSGIFRAMNGWQWRKNRGVRFPELRNGPSAADEISDAPTSVLRVENKPFLGFVAGQFYDPSEICQIMSGATSGNVRITGVIDWSRPYGEVTTGTMLVCLKDIHALHNEKPSTVLLKMTRKKALEFADSHGADEQSFFKKGRLLSCTTRCNLRWEVLTLETEDECLVSDDN